ncbi:MAG: hypothetical protein A2X49_13650 [Lentisphaerae bacterium GWF2_52_8]|nr:MAG: hypothetical protein A2X49_13650 [Lentisphaerae bacterium GWF2_52_8]
MAGRKKNSAEAVPDSLLPRLARALASCNVLFQVMRGNERVLGDFDQSEFLNLFIRALEAMRRDLGELPDTLSSANCLCELVGEKPDSIDQLNALARFCANSRPFSDYLEASLSEAISPLGDSQLAHLSAHAGQLCSISANLIPDYILFLGGMGRNGLSRISPDARLLCIRENPFKSAGASSFHEAVSKLRGRVSWADPFQKGRTFRYYDGKFHPVELNKIRPVEKFYGYLATRRQFKTYFEAFANGGPNLPLLITSLPGLGKTHFSIAHVLACPGLTLVLPEPCDLERPLEGMIRSLARRPQGRFVLFFDDVDTRKVDWYHFRTNVGGSLSLPSNIIIVIASNFEFPANISSRGRGFVFPIFDEINCQEMVHDFLISLGMRNPSTELVAVIASDYIEEFGQKMFEELSPRTLVRYLERYELDAAKRKRMLELSRQELISRPDSQVFMDVNVKLLRQLYGEEALQELRERLYGKK